MNAKFNNQPAKAQASKTNQDKAVTIKFPLHKDDFSDIIDSDGVLIYSAAVNSADSMSEAEANRDFVFNCLTQHAALVAVAEAAKVLILTLEAQDNNLCGIKSGVADARFKLAAELRRANGGIL